MSGETETQAEDHLRIGTWDLPWVGYLPQQSVERKIMRGLPSSLLVTLLSSWAPHLHFYLETPEMRRFWIRLHLQGSLNADNRIWQIYIYAGPCIINNKQSDINFNIRLPQTNLNLYIGFLMFEAAVNCVLAGGIVLQVREESSSCSVLKEQTGGGTDWEREWGKF